MYLRAYICFRLAHRVPDPEAIMQKDRDARFIKNSIRQSNIMNGIDSNIVRLFDKPETIEKWIIARPKPGNAPGALTLLRNNDNEIIIFHSRNAAVQWTKRNESRLGLDNECCFIKVPT